jgi:hypothetical protein
VISDEEMAGLAGLIAGLAILFFVLVGSSDRQIAKQFYK